MWSLKPTRVVNMEEAAQGDYAKQNLDECAVTPPAHHRLPSVAPRCVYNPEGHGQGTGEPTHHAQQTPEGNPVQTP